MLALEPGRPLAPHPLYLRLLALAAERGLQLPAQPAAPAPTGGPRRASQGYDPAAAPASPGTSQPSPVSPPSGPSRPYVIAHRGASGYFPEHTLAAYGVAILLGADFIEPDLVMTSDGELVARHDNLLDLTTDVADRREFAKRRRRQQVDGHTVAGWFSEDFTLAELRTLRARERIPQLRPANARFDGRFGIPTLQEIIDLVEAMAAVTGRRAGIYPETKHPSHFAARGLALEAPLVDVLHRNGYRGAEADVFIQSFEIANLQRLRTLTEVPLVQLLGEPHEQPRDRALNARRTTYRDLAAADGLAAIADYANGIGPDKGYLTGRWRRILSGDALVERCHELGLQVHPYTFRAENAFLPRRLQFGDSPAGTGDLAAELQPILALGIDGFFIDQADVGAKLKAIARS